LATISETVNRGTGLTAFDLQNRLVSFWDMSKKKILEFTRYPIAFVALFVQIFLIIAMFLYASLAFTPPGSGPTAGRLVGAQIVYGFVIGLFLSFTLWDVGFSIREEQTRGTLEAQLNSLLHRPLATPVGTLAQVQPSVLPYSLDDLLAAAEASFPVLKRQQALVEGDRLAVELARKEVRPNFSLGYTYMQRAGIGDMYGLTFSTSLPIFRRSKQDQAIAEAVANLHSSRNMEAHERAVLQSRLKQETLQAQAADQLLKLYSQAIMPQSTLTVESSVLTYETGMTDFTTVIMNFTTVLDYELNYQQQLVNHEKALARLEELTGLTLIP